MMAKSFRFPANFHWMLLLAFLTIPRLAHAQWRAMVGAQSGDLGRQAMAFLPNEMWIHTGDDITWTFSTDEKHTVTFLKPGQTRLPYQVGCPGFSPDGSATFDGSTCVTTPASTNGQTFTVVFPSTGNFKLVCLVHRDMTATIHVLNPVEPLPHDQAFYDLQSNTDGQKLLSGPNLEAQDQSHQHSSGNEISAGAGVISATPGGLGNLVIMRFMRDEIVIHAGETVEWSNLDSTASHTITFGTEPADPMPPSANITVDSDGARHAVINSTADSVHSGFIVAGSQERTGVAQLPLTATRFRITFTHAGVYPYICALHDILGMKGTVIVLP